jgi:pimeloyl-ACP methyl ester carboxylesterase
MRHRSSRWVVIAVAAAVVVAVVAPAAAPAAASPAAASPAAAPPAAASPVAASPGSASPAPASQPPAAAAATAPSAQPALDTAPYSFRTVEGAGGVPLNVVTVGDPDNPPILFVHGLAQSYLSFERQFRSELAGRYFLVGFDLRGHGNSGKPWDRTAYADAAIWGEDVERVVGALQLRRPVIVGWSYGTLVAVDYLRRAGADAVAGVVLVGAYGGLTPPPNMSAVPPAMAQNRLRQLSPDLGQNYAAARFTVGLLTAEPMPQDWSDRAAAIALMLPRVAREGMFMRRIDSRDLLPGLAGVPFLVNVGTKDISTPEPTARELAKQLPKATVSVYEGVGHSPFVESPERFNRELAAFADRAFAGRKH